MQISAPCSRNAVLKRRNAESGFALVLVLAVSAVAAAMIVAFVLRSTGATAVNGSELAERKVEELGEVIRSILLNDLRQEMRAGSHYPGHSGESSLVRVQTPEGKALLLYPASPQTAVPARTAPESDGGFQKDFPNLLKWSSRYSTFYPEQEARVFVNAAHFPPPAPAAPVSTKGRPSSGPALRDEFWRAPMLLPDDDAGGAVEIPQPDWILVTSRGSRVRNLGALASDPVVGRFAFMMYDQGGLLDLNVAGFAPCKSSEDFVGIQRGLKGGVGLADLGVFMESIGASQAEARAFHESLLQWRNEGSYAASGTLSAAARLRDAILGERFGFLGWRPQGDRSFVGRHQLIQFVRRQFPSNRPLASELLQRVTHFTRELAQPSLYPEPGRAPVRFLGDGAPVEDWDEVNPAFLEQRFREVEKPAQPDGAGVPGPGQTQGAGAGAELQVAGRLLVPKRFPLSRLALLGGTLSAGNEALIWKYFGLKPTPSSGLWSYRGGSAGSGRILTLAEVLELPPGQAREPDFLELLKASIVPGAILVAPQRPSQLLTLDETLIQIFANLVDQFDSDGYPTRIQFRSAKADAEDRIISGTEHLPYLHRVRTLLSPDEQSIPPSPFITGGSTASGTLFTLSPVSDPGLAWVWQDVSVWNPHALSGDFGGPGPTQFRVRCEMRSPVALRAAQSQSLLWEEVHVPQKATGFAASGFRVEGDQVGFVIPRSGLPGISKSIYLSDASRVSWMRVEPRVDNRMPDSGIRDLAGNGVVGIAFAQVPRLYSTEIPVGMDMKKVWVLPSHYEVVSEWQNEEPVLMDYRLEYAVPGPEETLQWIEYDRKRLVPVREASWLEVHAPEPQAWEFSDPRCAWSGVPGAMRATPWPVFFSNRFRDQPVSVGADGVVRRGSGAFVLGSAVAAGAAPPDAMAAPSAGDQLPVILNRPFRSVGEMAYAWSGQPWKQLDLSLPESGFGGVLDVFCVNENEHPRALEAGRVNLNTRQPEVLEAVLFGARLDEAAPAGVLSSGAWGSARRIARALVEHTASRDPRKGPLRNVRDLAGSWRVPAAGLPGGMPVDGSAAHGGFSLELPEALGDAAGVLRSERARSAVVRALADAGGTRVWNLLLDVVVQTGQYPRVPVGNRVGKGGVLISAQERDAAQQRELQRFSVQAQKRFWWHLAVDRLTGEVLDEMVEPIDP